MTEGPPADRRAHRARRVPPRPPGGLRRRRAPHGFTTGAVCGISLRSAAVRDALAPQDFVYHVVERASVGRDVREVVRPVGALLGVDVAARGRRDRAGPTGRRGRHGRDDHGHRARLLRVGPGGPSTSTARRSCTTCGAPLPAFAARPAPRGARPPPRQRHRAVHRRLLRQPAGQRPATARVVRDLAECRDPSLAAWVDGNVAFPSSMVDRMVPATTAEDREQLRREGIVDAWPVVTEPFSQWVLEDTFPAGRPPWERAGVELVSDVAVHEQAKLRILNAAHSALAYWGLLAGHRLGGEAVADPVLLDATRDLLSREVIPTLDAPPGWNLAAYAEQVLERFGNRALATRRPRSPGTAPRSSPCGWCRRCEPGWPPERPPCDARRSSPPGPPAWQAHGRRPSPSTTRSWPPQSRSRPAVARPLPGCDCRLAGPAGVPRGPLARRARFPRRSSRAGRAVLAR